MDESRQTFLRALPAHVYTLEAARAVFARGEPEAVPSVQRMIRSVADTARRAGYPDIVRAAVAASEEAPRVESLEALLTSLRKLANGHDVGQTHILVIEDDPVTSRFIDALLAAPGHQVHLCRTLAEAELAMATHDVSLVILDIGLPDGDGRNLLARLRRQPFHASLPVIVVSGSAGTQARTECFALGADVYVFKPFSPEELTSLVHRFIARH